MSKSRAQFTLGQVYVIYRAAPVVWLALQDMAGRRRSSVITPTRAELAKATGIRRHRTISTALSVLEAAGWLSRIHIPVNADGHRTATLLRLMLCRKGQKLTHTGKNSVWVKNRPKGKGQKLTQDSPTEREAATRANAAGSYQPLPQESTTPAELAYFAQKDREFYRGCNKSRAARGLPPLRLASLGA